MSKASDEDIVKLARAYESKEDLTPLDCTSICNKLGDPFDKHCTQDPGYFLETIVKHYSSLTSAVKHQVVVETLCNETISMDKEQIVTTIAIPNDRKCIKMNDLFKSINEWKMYDNVLCNTCNIPLRCGNR